MWQLPGHLTPTRLADTPCATSAWKSMRQLRSPNKSISESPTRSPRTWSVPMISPPVWKLAKTLLYSCRTPNGLACWPTRLWRRAKRGLADLSFQQCFELFLAGRACPVCIRANGLQRRAIRLQWSGRDAAHNLEPEIDNTSFGCLADQACRLRADRKAGHAHGR